ncbi:GGDEF domain-containing protein [Shewanella nanhaiensis]|uniref:diguanylate cyclase n=1 Tax=Shewanella nanhaiensis TaxID=2864872 RepID=A0ABS7E709_9GAMM|nr:GGDEF domain-containing protein [Shewanella nanhaiensis]MBW8185471.1 diguanylate cyclase [Shewanella nanhaiensis]
MNMDNSLLNSELITFISSNSPLLQVLVDTMPVPIFYKDRKGCYLGCNRAFEEFIELPRDELIGRNVYQLYDKELADVYAAADRELMEKPGKQVYEKQIRTLKGLTRFVKFHKTSFVDSQQNVAGIIGIIFDITEQKRLEMQLVRHATYDDLTGLLNRREGLNRVSERYELAKRTAEPFSLLMMDVDHFKRVNDQHGHLVGDKALKFIAELLRGVIRQEDILIRYGGEEFMLLLINVDEALALELAESCRFELARRTMKVGKHQEISFTLSIGLSSYREQVLTELIHEADTALYEAKNRNRNNVCIY